MLDPSRSKSEPPPGHTAHASARASDAFGNAQTIGALLLGILLFAVPLYLWRRPHAPASTMHADAGTVASALRDGALPVAATPDAGRPHHVKLGDPRVIECHDRGSRRTPPDQCDHIAAFEKAFAEAILSADECVPTAAGPGSIEFLADLSFARRRRPVMLTLPRDGRSFQKVKIVKDCSTMVRAKLAAFPVAGLQHGHARYKLSILASYDGVTTH